MGVILGRGIGKAYEERMVIYGLYRKVHTPALRDRIGSIDK